MIDTVPLQVQPPHPINPLVPLSLILTIHLETMIILTQHSLGSSHSNLFVLLSHQTDVEIKRQLNHQGLIKCEGLLVLKGDWQLVYIGMVKMCH